MRNSLSASTALKSSICAAALLLMTACGEGAPTGDTSESETTETAQSSETNAPTRGVDRVSEAALAHYAENPDFFKFATPADLPADLTWEDGMDLPEIGSDNAKKGGTRHSAMQDFPRSLRVVGPDSNGSFRNLILDDVTMGMATRHPNQPDDFYNGIATEWAIDWPGRTIYVRMNPKAKWSDGVAITSNDMLYMFYLYQSEHIKAPWYNNWYSSKYQTITKYDDLTFSITVPKARPDMNEDILPLRPMPEHFYHDLGDDFVEKFQWEFQPTTGPYIIREDDIKKGRAITLRRNDEWWARDNKFYKNRYNPDRIRVQVIRDAAKSFEAFKKGELDSYGLNLSEFWYDKLPNDDEDVAGGYIHKSVFYNEFPRPKYGLYLNTAKPGLNDINVRLGLQHASNWQGVVDRYFRGDPVRMENFHEGYGRFTNDEVRAREYSVEKALQYFAKAGYTIRGDDGILTNEAGDRLSFQLTTGYEVLKDVLTILREDALKAGVELRLEVLDGSAGWKKVNEKKHDIMFTAFGTFLEPYPRFWDFFHSDNAWDTPYLEDGSINPDRQLKVQTNNFFSWGQPEMDEWINTYRASEDEAEMYDLAMKMQVRIHDEAMFVPAWVYPFYRVGHWRWMKFPEDFNLKHSSTAADYHVHWIDVDLRKETMAARKAGVTFDPVIKVYDQYKKD